jgi:pimeloyl-ACP methyl ester carboxylesterase
MRLPITLVLCLGFLWGSIAARADAKRGALDGDWQGSLAVPGGGSLRLALHVTRDPHGALAATIDSLDQGATGLAAQTVRVDGRHVVIVLKAPAAEFAGDLDDAGQLLSGQWKQGGTSLALVLHRGSPAAEPPPELWFGKLTFSAGLELRVVLRVTRLASGVHAVLDSPDQSATGIPIDTVSFDGGVLRFTSAKLGASYVGKLDAAGAQAVGEFTQRSVKTPLTLAKTDKVPERPRPQTPKPPFPYRAEEVAYDNTAAKLRLAGTLLLPEGAGPFPAALLITGSGPQDRDESLMGHKPFLVLADALARRGIAVLRVDDRGVGSSTGSFATATSEDFAGDAAAGVAYLRGRKEIDAHRVGLVGHSEGGLIGPMVAARSKDVAYVVMLAGPGLPGADIILAQQELIARATGETDEAALKRNRDDGRRLFDLIKREKDPAVLENKARALVEASLAKATAAEKKQMGDPAVAANAMLEQMLTPWFRYFLTYDPRPALSKVRCPVLALNGEKDLQVPPKDNLPAIASALKAGGNRDVTTREMPGLNHLFQTAKTGAPGEYGAIEETMSPAVLTIIGDWILAHAKK